MSVKGVLITDNLFRPGTAQYNQRQTKIADARRKTADVFGQENTDWFNPTNYLTGLGNIADDLIDGLTGGNCTDGTVKPAISVEPTSGQPYFNGSTFEIPETATNVDLGFTIKNITDGSGSVDKKLTHVNYCFVNPGDNVTIDQVTGAVHGCSGMIGGVDLTSGATTPASFHVGDAIGQTDSAKKIVVWGESVADSSEIEPGFNKYPIAPRVFEVHFIRTPLPS
jgi:hypothetical protein